MSLETKANGEEMGILDETTDLEKVEFTDTTTPKDTATTDKASSQIEGSTDLAEPSGVQVLWNPNISTTLDVSLESDIKAHLRRYDFLKSKLLDKKPKDIPYFESVRNYNNSVYELGFCIVVVLKVNYGEKLSLKVMDPEGVYTLDLDPLISLSEIEKVFEGIQIGVSLRKKINLKYTRQAEEDLENPIRQAVTDLYKKEQIVLQSFSFPGYVETPWAQDNKNKKSKMVLISDIHVGSKYYLKENFIDLLRFIASNKEIKYVALLGDIVDGNSVFPGHWTEIDIDSVLDQYRVFATLLAILRPDQQLIVMPGNHDACGSGRAEPQAFSSRVKDIFYQHLEGRKIHFVSNPCYLKIEQIYCYFTHGTSHNALINALASSTTKLCTLLEYLSEIRNISPIRSAVPIAPTNTDYHVIPDKVNIFCSGHMHNQSWSLTGKNRLCITLGAWQHLTNYMKLLGIVPSIAKCVLVDLNDPRETLELDFSSAYTAEKTYEKASIS